MTNTSKTTSAIDKTETQFQFGTKAETLERLKGRVHKSSLCDQVIISVGMWQNDQINTLDTINAQLKSTSLIIRSSARSEDTAESSLAGAHLSIANVPAERSEITHAVNAVFASYTHDNADDEVLVQPMITDVAISGVVLTRDLDTGSPYYVINYDEDSGRTDTVTGGHETKSVLVHRARPDKLTSPRLRHLVDCVIEIEGATGSHELDIEFCIKTNDDVFILQTRPLAAKQQWTVLSDQTIDHAIDTVRAQISELIKPVDGLGGARTILSEMTDWNPAEIIGNAPRPLALSLYKDLITDHVWADARTRMGYRKVEGALLFDLAGRPFIDVRKSLNSFLPADVENADVDILVSHQLECLSNNRALHDKVEFEIAVTCRDFNAGRIPKRLSEAGFSDQKCAEINSKITTLTGAILHSGADALTSLIEEANTLLKPSSPAGDTTPIANIQEMLNACRHHGTLPFAQLARHGFIGVQLLNSLVDYDVFTDDDAADFMRSVETVTTSLITDMHAMHTKEISLEVFLNRYGHLRPGTYDIMSWRYEEMPELFLGRAPQELDAKSTLFSLSPKQRNAIQSLITDAKFDVTVDGLLDYIVTAIKGREQSKFAFTRSISDALKLLTVWGETRGFSRDDLSFLNINSFSDNADPGALRIEISMAKKAYALTRAIRLPHLIADPSDIDVVRLPLGQPNFVTNKSVTAPAQVLNTSEVGDIDDCIVLIESADPGFDWIFSHRVSGLITKYGGANSHMAIRCAEFGLPAAIGCGERLFDTLSKARTIELNAATRQITSH